MKKELISEISRIHEIMGVKNTIILNENVACPLCDVINSKIDDLARKFANKEIGYSRFQYEVDELIRKVESGVDDAGKKILTSNELAGFSQIKKNLDNLKKTSDSIDSYKTAVKNTINNTGSLSDRPLSSAKNIKTKIIDNIDWDTIGKTQEYSDYVFKNSSEVNDTLSSFDSDWLSKTEDQIKKFIDTYKTIDVYAENIKKIMKSYFIESGIEETLAENLSNMFKTWTKENPNINKHFPNVAPVVDNKTAKTIERRVGPGFGSNTETLPENLANRYFELVGKNVDELTEEEKLFIQGVEDWKLGKNVDFNNLKKEEEVIETGGTDVNSDDMDDATSGEIYELFGKTRDQVDIEGLNAVQNLGIKLSDMADKPTDPDVILGNKIKNAIRKGKKFESATDEEITSALKNLGLEPNEITSILKRIKNPIKGYSVWYRFYWRVVEPLFRGWIAAAKRLIQTFSLKPPTTKEITVEFIKSAEKALVNFDSTIEKPSYYIAQLRELRNKFQKISSVDPETYKYYSLLFSDWDTYMRKNLTGQQLTDWEKFSQKLTSGGDSDYFGFIDKTWKEMLGKELKGTQEGDMLDRVIKGSTIKRPSSSVIKIFENIIKDPSVEKFWLKLLKKAVSWFFTNFFTTPRQMEEFFIQNRYGNASFYGIKLPVEVTNLLKTQLYRWVYVPAWTYFGYILIDTVMTISTGADWGDADFFDIWKGVNMSGREFNLDKNVYEELPEWYKVMKNIGIFHFTPPFFDLSALGMAVAQSDNEEKFEKGSEKTKRLVNESYEKSLQKANEQALNKYNQMSSEEQNQLQKDALLPSITLMLQNSSYYLPFLTTEEAKFISDRIEFRPSIPLTARASISQKIGKIDMEKVTDVQTVELDDKDIIVVGNVILKGKDGDYLAIPVSNQHDPDNIRNKTTNPKIKGYWAWIKPKFNDLKIGTSRKYYDLKEFVEENK